MSDIPPMDEDEAERVGAVAAMLLGSCARLGIGRLNTLVAVRVAAMFAEENIRASGYIEDAEGRIAKVYGVCLPQWQAANRAEETAS